MQKNKNTKNTKRALRRHHARRIRDKVKREFFGWKEWIKEDNGKLWVAKRAKTRQMCSCLGCSNGRRWRGPEINELRGMFHLEKWEEEE